MNKTLATRISTIVATAAIGLTLSACNASDIDKFIEENSNTPTSTSAPVSVDTEGDYFTVTGKAELDYDAVKGEIRYCETDHLERPVCAYGELTHDMRTDAIARGRQSINVDPAGWPEKNDRAHIPALESVEGSKDYNGWFWNRSHLIADSIGGGAIVENLVTGTRPQNVGSVGNSGGMAYTEVIARDYLDSDSANNCPLYYSATPHYTGDELIPRTVTVDIQSCDKSIDERVEVSNSANGYAIDYNTGVYTEK